MTRETSETAACPCCQRAKAGELASGTPECAECRAAGCAGSEYATAELPYPYCAVTDSSPLA